MSCVGGGDAPSTTGRLSRRRARSNEYRPLEVGGWLSVEPAARTKATGRGRDEVAGRDEAGTGDLRGRCGEGFEGRARDW